MMRTQEFIILFSLFCAYLKFYIGKEAKRCKYQKKLGVKSILLGNRTKVQRAIQQRTIIFPFEPLVLFNFLNTCIHYFHKNKKRMASILQKSTLKHVHTMFLIHQMASTAANSCHTQKIRDAPAKKACVCIHECTHMYMYFHNA